MKKKLLTALIGAVLLSAAGCTTASNDPAVTEPAVNEATPTEAPVEAPEETPAEKTNVVEDVIDKPDFTGDYTESITGRCKITIEHIGGDDHKINVIWANSAAESSNWEITATYYESTGLLEYNGGRYYVRKFTDDGNYTDEVRYNDGAGEFWLTEDGKLGWRSSNSDVDNITGETFFERLPINNGMANPWTDVESAEAAAEGAEVGYFNVPKSKELYNDHLVYITGFRYMEHLAQADGSIGAAELTIRKGLKQESSDVSGDYTQYAYEWSFTTEDSFTVNCSGNEEGKIMKAIWLSDNFSYSVNVMGQGDESDTYGLDEETMKLLIAEIQ